MYLSAVVSCKVGFSLASMHMTVGSQRSTVSRKVRDGSFLAMHVWFRENAVIRVCT